ncbi:hypothetical protein [Streptomyces shenzhenensis]|uniref:hypothetical protein n=1 Tax=Streptomyces shenzhenensis TaxID=943815 RepID=UPI003674DFBC
MTTFAFAPAARETAEARIAHQGPGGSGKTKTALRIAEGLGKGGLLARVGEESKKGGNYGGKFTTA